MNNSTYTGWFNRSKKINENSNLQPVKTLLHSTQRILQDYVFGGKISYLFSFVKYAYQQSSKIQKEIHNLIKTYYVCQGTNVLLLLLLCILVI